MMMFEGIFSALPFFWTMGEFDVEEFFKEGVKHFEMGNYEKAREVFKKIVEKHPQSPRAKEALFLLGKAYIQLREMGKAVEIFQAFIEKYPQSALLHHSMWNLAHCCEYIYDFRKSAELYELLLEKFPRYGHTIAPYALLRLGHCYLQLGKIGMAVRSWESIMSIITYENTPELYKLYGDPHSILGTIYLPRVIELYKGLPEEVLPFLKYSPSISPKRTLVGPISDAYWWGLAPANGTRRLLLVYGTQGDPEDNEATRKMAEEKQVDFMETSNLVLEIKKDVEVNEEDIENRELLIIGNPKCNSLLAKINDKLPIKVEGDAIVAGDRRYEGKDKGAIMAVPNPLNPERYVIIQLALSPKDFFSVPLLAPAANADYIILKRAYPRTPESILEEGFFLKPNPINWEVVRQGVN